MGKKYSRCILLFSLIVCSLAFTSCTAYKGLPYLVNVNHFGGDSLISGQEINELIIKPNDILSIVVSSTIPGAANDFNLPMVANGSTAINPSNVTGGTANTSSGTLQNYLVDKNGEIDFPVFGKIKVTGLTPRKLKDWLTDQIYPRYITSRPTVTVRLINFTVSILGEVAKPGQYTSDNGQMTLLDALASAGDLTLYGKRNNVLLIRTLDNSDVITYRIDMQDKNSISRREVFYLQQGDKLYVETNKARGNNSAIGTLETLSLSAISLLISVITIVTR